MTLLDIDRVLSTGNYKLYQEKQFSLKWLIYADQMSLMRMPRFIIKELTAFGTFPFCKTPIIMSVHQMVFDRLCFAFSCLWMILFIASRIYALSPFHHLLDRVHVLGTMCFLFVLQIRSLFVPSFVANMTFIQCQNVSVSKQRTTKRTTDIQSAPKLCRHGPPRRVIVIRSFYKSVSRSN